METNNNNENNQVPSIAESELKLPEEQFGQDTPVVETKHSFNPLLFGLLVVLLVLLALVIIWGEQLVGLILPDQNMELSPLPENTEQMDNGTEAELQAMEMELDEFDFSDIERELDGIEAEIEAELSADAEATTP